jgi:hypothetical protein
MLFVALLELLELLGEVEDRLEFLARPVGDPGVVASFQRFGDVDHGRGILSAE